jgi:hypothetical protein
MMFNSSLFVLLGAAIIGQTYSAATLKLTADVPVMMWSTGKSAASSAQCKEQFVFGHS